MKETLSDETKASEGKALERVLGLDGRKKVEITAATGVAGAYISQIIAGTRPMNLDTAVKLADFLKVPIESFSPRLASLAIKAANNALSTTKQHAHIEVKEPFSAYNTWPFRSVSLSRFKSLSISAQEFIDSTLGNLVSQWEDLEQTKVKRNRTS